MATLSVAIIVAGIWAMRMDSGSDFDHPRLAELSKHPSSGKSLHLSELEPGDRIEVVQIMCRHGLCEAHSYSITRENTLMFTEQKSEIQYDRSYGLRSGKVLETHADELNPSEAVGIEKFLSYLRHRLPVESRFYDTFQVTYFKSEREIGSENFICDSWYGLPVQNYEEWPPDIRAHLSRAELTGIIPFDFFWEYKAQLSGQSG